MKSPVPICVLDGPAKRARRGAARGPTSLGTYARVRDALDRSSVHDVWVVASDRRFADLVRAVADNRRAVHRLTLFSYSRPDSATAVVLESAFARLLLGPGATLPIDQLVLVLQTEHPEDFCVAAEWIPDAKAVALWRGDFSMLTVPFAWFRSEVEPQPDPSRLAVGEYGGSIVLGDYEASFDAVLYERDPNSRRRMRARMRAKDRTLGGSLWRLRNLRGVRRDEFGAIDEKTIARIERGEVKRPQRATLAAIAARLGVKAGELESY